MPTRSSILLTWLPREVLRGYPPGHRRMHGELTTLGIKVAPSEVGGIGAAGLICRRNL